MHYYRQRLLKGLFLFVFSVIFAGQVSAAVVGRVTSIDPAGYVYIDIGQNQGLKDGDMIEIRDNGDSAVIELEVRRAYDTSSQLEAPRRRNLSKIEVGYPVYLIREISQSVLESEPLDVSVLSFDITEQTAFVNAGYSQGLSDGMVFQTEDGRYEFIIDRTFERVSKLRLYSRIPVDYRLSGQLLILKKEQPIVKQSVMSRLLRNVSGEIRSYYTHYSVRGDETQSFYKSGNNYREEADIRFNKSLQDGTTVDGFVSARWTDDTYVDTQRYSLEKFYIKAKNENYEVAAGDVLANFSTYTLLSSLKGINSSFFGENGFGDWQASAVYGVNKTKWEDLWSDNDGEAKTRMVYGTRFKQVFDKDTFLGFNLVRSDDDQDSHDSGTPQDNAVFSVDWKVKPMSFFTVKGELARSLTQKDETSNDIKWSDDSAVNIDTEAVFGKVRLQNNYERVGTNFTSLSGVASADREERQHRIYYDYSKNFGVDAGWRTYHNNLSNTLSTGTVNNIYDINTFIKPIPDVLPDMKLDADYEIWKKCSDDDASTIDSTKHTYGFGLENTTSIYRYGAGISFENTVDDVALNNSRQKVIYDAFLRSNYQWGKFRLIPYLSYEYERDKTRSVKATDDYQTFRLGSSMYWGSNMSLTWSFARANIDYESDGNDQRRDFIDVNLRMNLFNNPDKSVKIVYRHNDYDKEDDSVSFIEDILTCMYSFNF